LREVGPSFHTAHRPCGKDSNLQPSPREVRSARYSRPDGTVQTRTLRAVAISEENFWPPGLHSATISMPPGIKDWADRHQGCHSSDVDEIEGRLKAFGSGCGRRSSDGLAQPASAGGWLVRAGFLESARGGRDRQSSSREDARPAHAGLAGSE
jgi:hypothetical protein